MAWLQAAGLAVSALGALSSRSASRSAARQAARSQEAANEASMAQLEFQREQYDDWQNIFGDIQENLSEFYRTLSSDFIEAQGIEQFEKERSRALTQIRENFAQRGIGDSGLATQAETDLALMSAEQRAQIRANAPMQAAQQRAGFLQIGLGQNPQGQMSQALGQRTQFLGNQANTNTQLAMQAAGASSQAMQQFGQEAIGFIQDWRDRRSEGGG